MRRIRVLCLVFLMLISCMGFAGCSSKAEDVNLAEHQIALMDQYMPTIQMTGFSDAPVKTVTITAKTTGRMTVSVIRIADIGKNDAPITAVKTFDLVQGENKLDVNVTLAEGETLVLGAQDDTAVLAGASEGAGLYVKLGEKISGLDSRIKLSVQYDEKKEINQSVLKGFDTYLQQNDYFRVMDPKNAPYAHNDLDLYENSTIQYINAYVKSVSEINDDQYLTVYVANKADFSIVSSHKFYAKSADLGTNAGAVDKLVVLTAKEAVSVNAGQTLLFAAADDPMKCGYDATCKDVNYLGFYYGGSKDKHDNLCCLGLDVFINAKIDFKYESHIANLQSLEKEAAQTAQMMNALKGKGISLIGDSISTFEGWSNNTAYNNSIGNNAIFYNTTFFKQEDTYWQQLIDRNGMELVVNNAWSGSRVFATDASSGWDTRCENLHNNAGRKPDVVVVYFGTNDLNGNVPFNTDFSKDFFAQVETEGFMPINFDEAYALMIYKIQKNYPDAEIFCCTLPDNTITSGSLNVRYNTVIKNIASHYKANVVDLYSTELSKNYSFYTIDGLHPNAEGMDILTEAIMDAMKKVFCKD